MLMEEEEDLEKRPCMLQDSLALQATEKSFYDALSADLQINKHTCVNYCTEKGQKYPQRYKDFSDFVEGATSSKHLAICSEGLDQTELYDTTLLCSSKNPGFYSDPPCCQSTTDGSIEEQLAYKPLYVQSRKPKRGRPRAGAGRVIANAVDLWSLLTQCAQALVNYDIRIAQKLKLIRLHCSPYGEATERMAHYFADALEARLAGTGVELYTAFAKRTISAFFVTRFKEALFHFSSLFDMMEATVPRENQERVLFEKVNFGMEIMNIVACEGTARVERPEPYKQRQLRNHRAGFRLLPLDQDIVKEVRAKVQQQYHKDFLVDEDGYWMLQGWKGRVIYALSCWKPVDN